MPGENDLVLADYRAAAYGRDADLLAPPGLTDAMALEHVLRLIGQGGCRRLRKHQGCTARRIHFAAVVLFDYLHVKALAQHSCGTLYQLYHQVNAQRHVSGLENRYALRSLFNAFELLL